MVGLIEQEPILKLKKLFDTKEFDEIITYCHELLKKDEDNLIALHNNHIKVTPKGRLHLNSIISKLLN